MKWIGLLMTIALGISCSTTDPMIIAHRSASGYLPEHTLEGLAMAHAFNPDFIEPDVVLSKDGHPVILHDVHLDATTNVKEVYPKRKRNDGRYYAIDFSLNELKKLKVHERVDWRTGKKIYKDRFPLGVGNFTIPTLEEWIELLQGLNRSRKKKVGIFLEFKAPAFHEKEGQDIVAIIMEKLKKYGYDNKTDEIFIECFDPGYLKKIKQQYPTSIPLVQLIGENSWKESSADYEKMQTLEGLREIGSYAQGIGPWYPQVIDVEGGKPKETNLVRDAHQLGLRVFTYTLRQDALPDFVNSQSELIQALKQAGVDGYFTDFADIK
jgi:glycerophosphoryl diester phosphodiesterase